MVLLAADTSISPGSVALRGPDGKVLREDLNALKPHSETLLPVIEQVLARAGCTRDDVQAIAVGTGPGTFTGLRVGLATFQAWARASSLPLIPVVSLDAVACPLLGEGIPVIVLMDARKSELYAAYYPSLDGESLPKRQGEVMLIPHGGVLDWITSLNDPNAHLVGTGLSYLKEKDLLDDQWKIDSGSGLPDATWILFLAETLLSLGRTVKPSALVPSYVRSPDAKEPSPGTFITGIPGTDGPADS